MPLLGTGPVLGEAMLKAIDAAVEANPSVGKSQRVAIWNAIGDAIVAHIVANGVVLSVSGVTTGTGVSGPGKLG